MYIILEFLTGSTIITENVYLKAQRIFQRLQELSHETFQYFRTPSLEKRKLFRRVCKTIISITILGRSGIELYTKLVQHKNTF